MGVELFIKNRIWNRKTIYIETHMRHNWICLNIEKFTWWNRNIWKNRINHYPSWRNLHIIRYSCGKHIPLKYCVSYWNIPRCLTSVEDNIRRIATFRIKCVINKIWEFYAHWRISDIRIINFEKLLVFCVFILHSDIY